MNKNEIRQKLIDILDDVAPSVEMSNQKSDEDLGQVGYDSLDLSSFLLEIEETFSVKISDEEVEELLTLNDFTANIESKLS